MNSLSASRGEGEPYLNSTNTQKVLVRWMQRNLSPLGQFYLIRFDSGVIDMEQRTKDSWAWSVALETGGSMAAQSAAWKDYYNPDWSSQQLCPKHQPLGAIPGQVCRWSYGGNICANWTKYRQQLLCCGWTSDLACFNTTKKNHY